MRATFFFYTFWREAYFRTYRPVAFKMMMYYFDKLALCGDLGGVWQHQSSR